MKSDMNRRVVKGDAYGNSTVIGGCRRYDRNDIGLIASKKFMPYFETIVSNLMRM